MLIAPIGRAIPTVPKCPGRNRGISCSLPSVRDGTLAEGHRGAREREAAHAPIDVPQHNVGRRDSPIRVMGGEAHGPVALSIAGPVTSPLWV
jgi:hypothetical protein